MDSKNGPRSVKRLNEFDCKGNKSRTLAHSAYSEHMGTGDVTNSNTETGNWRPVSYDGSDETLLKYACRKR